MHTEQIDGHGLVPWKHYVTIAAESLIAFYLSTFCIAMYFTHRGKDWVFPAIILVMLYLFVIFVCAKRILTKLPIATIMLLIPLAPLIVLIIVVSLIPVLQML